MFPGMDVQKGDIITVHLRQVTETPELCVSETSGDKTLSSAIGSSDNAWDLWADNSSSRLGASQDVITLENSNTGEIYQALHYSLSGKTEKWMNSKHEEKAKITVSSGIWEPSESVSDAFEFKTSANIQRSNVSEIVSMYDSGNITYPFASSAQEWTRISDGNITPGS